MRWKLYCGAVTGFIAMALLFPSLSQGASRSEIKSALESTVLPKLDFEGTPLEDAVRYVIDQVRISHPNLRKVRILYRSPFTKKDDTVFRPKFTLKLHDIPADVALAYIGQQTGRECSVGDNTIYVYPITWYDEEPKGPFSR